MKKTTIIWITVSVFVVLGCLYLYSAEIASAPVAPTGEEQTIPA